MTSACRSVRQSLVVLFSVVFLVVAGLGVVPADASSGVTPVLPVPSGRHAIGTVSLQLVDRSRPDPWVASARHRELMISVWYPALPSGGEQVAAYMQPGVAERFDAVIGPSHGIPSGVIDWAAVRTHARQGAAVDRRGGRRPVVLYSPGAGDVRTAQRAYVGAFFDRWLLRGHDNHLLDGPSARYPEVVFVG